MKKSQANIFVIMILIILILALIAVFWGAAKALIVKSSDKIDIKQFNVNLKIKGAYISENNYSMKVSVYRGSGKGEISVLKFVLEDEEGNFFSKEMHSRDYFPPEELETKTYYFIPSDFGIVSFSNVKSIKIAYGIEKESGEIIFSNLMDYFGGRNSDFRDRNNDVEISFTIRYGSVLKSCLDKDGDGYGECPNCRKGATDYDCKRIGEDCDDSNPLIWRKIFADKDGDGFGGDSPWICAGELLLEGFVGKNNDCDDANPNCFSECYHEVYLDKDNDGFGDPDSPHRECDAPLGYVWDDTDCNDDDASINIFQKEIKDGKDNNCNGLVDDTDCPVIVVPYIENTKIYTGISEFIDYNYKGSTYKVSPVLDVGAKNEMIHHKITINYTGTGNIKFSLGHYPSNSIASVFEKTSGRSSFQTIVPDAEKKVSTPYKLERYAWLILNITGNVNINKINHTYWVGENTAYGHKGYDYSFAGGNLPYRLLMPKNYNSSEDKQYPLFVSCPGSLGMGNNNINQMGMVIYGYYYFKDYYDTQKYDAFSLVPALMSMDYTIPDPYYHYLVNHTYVGERGKDSEFHRSYDNTRKDGFYAEATTHLIKELVRNCSLNIDPDRIYFNGHSFGAVATFEMMREDPGLWAATWPFSGGVTDNLGIDYTDYPDDDNLKRKIMQEVSRYNHIPIITVSGALETPKKSMTFACNLINLFGGNCINSIYAGANHDASGGRTMKNITELDWIYSKTKAHGCVDEDDDGYGKCPNCGLIKGCEKELGDCNDNNNYLFKNYIYYKDNDNDGKGGEIIFICTNGEKPVIPAGYSEKGGDCNDNNPDLFEEKWVETYLPICTNGTIPEGYN